MKIGFTRSQIHNNTKRFNINAPSQDDTLTQCYAAEVHSKLSTPHEMPEDVKSEWTAISNAVKSSGFKHRQHVRWMSPETYEILPRKAAACRNSDKKRAEPAQEALWQISDERLATVLRLPRQLSGGRACKTQPSFCLPGSKKASQTTPPTLNNQHGTPCLTKEEIINGSVGRALEWSSKPPGKCPLPNTGPSCDIRHWEPGHTNGRTNSRS